MGTKTIESSELIAKRVPPGDKWILIGDPKKEVFSSLTDTLEGFHQQTGLPVYEMPFLVC